MEYSRGCMRPSAATNSTMLGRADGNSSSASSTSCTPSASARESSSASLESLERVARCAQVAFAAERLARGNDRAVRERHGLGPLGAQYRDQQLDFIGIVAGANTQRVARLVQQGRFAQLERDVTDFALRA